MKLLAIDTSTEACSAALLVDGDISSRYDIAPRRHAELILPMCRELLDSAGLSVQQLDGLAFGRGPGAFTGVRIATGVIQGMAWAANLPVAPVSSLAAIAHQAMQKYDGENVAVAMDARMHEIYWACYTRQGDTVELVDEEAVIAPGKVKLPAGQWRAAGSGWQAYAGQLAGINGDVVVDTELVVHPHAASIVQLAQQVFSANEQLPAEQAIPVYLRDKVAERKT